MDFGVLSMIFRRGHVWEFQIWCQHWSSTVATSPLSWCLAVVVRVVESWSLWIFVGHAWITDGPRREASRLTPAALTDLISICNAQSEATPPFRSAAGKKRLAEIVETYYLSRNCGEAIKLSTTLRFVKAHQLAPFMDEAGRADTLQES